MPGSGRSQLTGKLGDALLLTITASTCSPVSTTAIRCRLLNLDDVVPLLMGTFVGGSLLRRVGFD